MVQQRLTRGLDGAFHLGRFVCCIGAAIPFRIRSKPAMTRDVSKDHGQLVGCERAIERVGTQPPWIEAGRPQCVLVGIRQQPVRHKQLAQ